jgi:hypothetical protein
LAILYFINKVFEVFVRKTDNGLSATLLFHVRFAKGNEDVEEWGGGGVGIILGLSAKYEIIEIFAIFRECVLIYRGKLSGRS